MDECLLPALGDWQRSDSLAMREAPAAEAMGRLAAGDRDLLRPFE
jgi:hypothetical protein